MIDFTLLSKMPRILMEAELYPVQGDRFQPTGFADIGPAEYSRPDANGRSGTPMLLVESSQSIANRLEKTCLDGDGPDIDPSLTGLAYVKVELKEKGADSLYTSSLVEAHRLASPYILSPEFKKEIESDMDLGIGAINWNKVYKTIFKYDPNSLIHGIFLSSIYGGRVRVPRALAGFIEAENAERVVSGGVKNSPVDPTGKLQVVGSTAEKGEYSNVPYSRVEYVASRIVAYFNIDLQQIRSYRLDSSPTNLLYVLSLLKVRRFLSSDLRLRTACNLALKDGGITANHPELSLPEEEDLLASAKILIQECKGLFSNPPVRVLNTPVSRKATKETGNSKAESEDNDE